MKAYAGKRRVYVFVDDLDRCQIPKAADLMQAINLMMSDDPQLVFVIGMDWETVAAGIAAKNAGLARYLKPSAEREGGAMELGREFMEKFIQLRFALPQPGEDELKRFLQALSQPQVPRRKPGFWRRHIGGRFLAVLSRLPILLAARFHGPGTAPLEQEGRQQPEAETPSTKLKELIQFDIDADSDRIQATTLALAPVFENNPRRLKQFLGLYRLRTYIAKQGGLFAEPEGRPRWKP